MAGQDMAVDVDWGPLVAANVMSSRSHSIFKEERYLIFMAPSCCGPLRGRW
ncbi:MAG: hypothetical protein R2911_29885 [Caldilineaceae bacterium]